MANTNPIKTRGNRGANAVDAQPQRLTSADGKRWATGRNMKRSEGGGRYTIVQAWNLKTRDADGKVITVHAHRDIAEARAWIAETSHHYFASTAFNWSVAPTREEAIAKVARAAGASVIKSAVAFAKAGKSNRDDAAGLYCYSVRVEVPQSAHYSINNYAPVGVPLSQAQHCDIVAVSGKHVLTRA